MANLQRQAVIVDAVRTPSGKGRIGGGLADVHPVDLLAQAFESLLARSPRLDPTSVDDVIVGCVSQVGEQSATPGRMAWLGAGFPVSVPATTIDRKCGSSQQAVHFAVQAISSGTNDVVVAGGIESMSRVVMGSARLDADPYGIKVTERFAPGLVSQGVASELVSAKWKVSRAELDSYAAESHRRASATLESGRFDRETIDVTTPRGVFSRDETVRPESSPESLAELPSVFRTDELAERFPEAEWSTTAGNSSQITDGASALLLMSAERARELELRPRARVRAMVAVGDDPLLMLTATIPATHKVLRLAGLTMSDIDHVELNEAFASVPLAWMREFGHVDPSIVNPRGGAIALGHPLGASGGRLMTTLIHALEDSDQQFGMQLMCEAGGMANATIIERL